MQPQRKTSSPDVMESCLEQRSRGVNKTLQRVLGEHQPIVVHRDLDRAAHDLGQVVLAESRESLNRLGFRGKLVDSTHIESAAQSMIRVQVHTCVRDNIDKSYTSSYTVAL